jgi:hypothetical protein
MGQSQRDILALLLVHSREEAVKSQQAIALFCASYSRRTFSILFSLPQFHRFFMHTVQSPQSSEQVLDQPLRILHFTPHTYTSTFYVSGFGWNDFLFWLRLYQRTAYHDGVSRPYQHHGKAQHAGVSLEGG